MRGKIESIQGLRGIAFIAIFLSHAGICDIAFLGAWGVSIFLVISGMMMYYSYSGLDRLKNVSGLKLAIKKTKKLYPLHVITMILRIPFAVVGQTTIGGGILVLAIILNLGLLQIYVPINTVYEALNGVSWYLCVAFLSYICFPQILRMINKLRDINQSLMLFLLLFFLQILIAIIAGLVGNDASSTGILTKQWIVYYFPPFRLIDFIIGCLLGKFYLNVQNYKHISTLECFLEIIIPFILVLSFYFYWGCITIFGEESIKYTLLFSPTTCAIVWLVAREKTFYAKFCSCRILVWVGNLSSYAFLIHTVVLKYLRTFNDILCLNISNFIIAGLSFVITIVLSIAYKKFLFWFDKTKDFGRNNYDT